MELERGNEIFLQVKGILNNNKINGKFPSNINELAEELGCERSSIYYLLRGKKCSFLETKLESWISQNVGVANESQKVVIKDFKLQTLKRFGFEKQSDCYSSVPKQTSNHKSYWIVNEDNVLQLCIEVGDEKIIVEDFALILGLVKEKSIIRENSKREKA